LREATTLPVMLLQPLVTVKPPRWQMQQELL
jgi:hypothetical protein